MNIWGELFADFYPSDPWLNRRVYGCLGVCVGVGVGVCVGGCVCVGVGVGVCVWGGGGCEKGEKVE